MCIFLDLSDFFQTGVSVGYYHLGIAFGISADLESAAKAKIPQYKSAIDNFTKAIELIPFADAYFYRGIANRDLGQSKDDQEEVLSLYEAAVKDFEETIRLDPNLKTDVQQMQRSAEETLEQLKK